MGLQRPVSLAEFTTLDDALPEEFVAERIGGRTVVTPMPDGDHSENVAAVANQLGSRASHLWLHVACPLAVGAAHENRFWADGAVAPHGHFRGRQPWFDPSGVPLVLEVTTGVEADAEIDRLEKRDVYAASGIPVYLLVDRWRREAVVHWGPAGGRYAHRASAVFGEKLSLPEPFGFELDTTEFA